MNQDKWKLTCTNCGEVYTVGENASIVTDEDLFNTILSSGGSINVHGELKREPDVVVKRVGLSSDEKNAILETAKIVQDDLEQGSKRQWHCGACSTVQSY